MPKSKVRKKPDAVRLSSPQPARSLAPSPTWYPIVMVALLLIGLAWLIVFYLSNSGTSPHIPVMAAAHNYNYLIGFGIMLLGLVMAVKWR